MREHQKKPSVTQQKAYLRVLRAIHAKPTLSQRELAQKLGLSLGNTNFYIQSFIGRGWLEARRFKNSKNRIAYTYSITPEGLEQRSKLTLKFLKMKEQEHEMLKREMNELKLECADKP